jgi:cytochrome P450
MFSAWAMLGMAVVAGVMYYVVLFLLQRIKLFQFPGPRSFPIIGNMYNPESLTLLRYLPKLAHKYGKCFQFAFLNNIFVVVCEPTVARRILSDTKSFPKGDLYTSGFGYVFGSGLVTSSGDKHKADRSRFSKFFVRSAVSKYVAVMNEKTEEALKEFMSSHDDNKSYDLEKLFAPLAIRIFSTFCLGKDLYKNNRHRETEMCEVVSSGSFVVGVGMVLHLPMHEWLNFLPWVKPPSRVKKMVVEDCKSVVHEAQEALKNAPEGYEPVNCLEQMVIDNISEKEINEHIVTLLCAGHDTTAFFSCYCCYMLAKHPDVQDKLRAEIVAQMGDRSTITEDDIAELKYFRKVSLETMRVFAIIPFLVRYTENEYCFKEAGITIPGDTNILVPLAVMNRDPDVWDFPNQFNPERFEGTEIASAKNGFFPFGYGGRVCVGNTLAMMESAVFICHILRQYQLMPDPNFHLKIKAGISLTSTNGILVKFKPL